MGTKHAGSAVVIGGSLAGLFAARVLSDRFDDVIILERDDLENTTEGHKGVPQGRHAHALLLSGWDHITAWFPGIDRDLYDGGAVPADQGIDVHWVQAGGLRAKFDTGKTSAVCSRPFLEEAVRARVEKLPNVELRTSAAVEGLTTTPDKSRITGVTLHDGTTVGAAVVIDCSGRTGRSVPWIAELGYAKPEVVEVGIDMHYTTRIYKRDDSAARNWKLAILIGDVPDEPLGVCFPLEGDRWMVTLAGYHGDVAPSEDDGFLAFARRLPDPALADTIASSAPLSDYRTSRMMANQRRLVEKMKRVPAGWALLGDSVASFNPVYGQGMSSASLQAAALGAALDASATVDAALTRRIHKGVGKAVTNAWMLSTGGDFAHPKTTGKRPPGTNLINKYLRRVFVAQQTDEVIARQMLAVGNLQAPVPSALSPRIALRALRHGKRRP